MNNWIEQLLEIAREDMRRREEQAIWIMQSNFADEIVGLKRHEIISLYWNKVREEEARREEARRIEREKIEGEKRREHVEKNRTGNKVAQASIETILGGFC